MLIVTVTDGHGEADRQPDKRTLSHSEVPQAKINLSSSLQWLLVWANELW